MKLILVRHGESEADILGVHEGRADFSLTKKGEKQAKNLGENLKKKYPKVKSIRVSTLKRAVETSIYVNEHYGLELIKEPMLMEMDNGKLAGLAFEEAEKLYPRPKNHMRGYGRKPGGESNLEFRARVESYWQKFFDEIVINSEKDDVHIIVSHGGTINNLIKSILEMPNSSNCIFPTEDTAYHTFYLDNEKKYILQLNNYEHILEDNN